MAQNANPREKPNRAAKPQEGPRASLPGDQAPWREEAQAARGSCFPAPQGSFPSITHLLTGRIPLHCSLADATLVLHREAGHTTVTSQPSLGASSRNGNSGVSHDAQKGSTLIVQLSSGASSYHHWSCAAKASAARWQSWGMIWENARV